MALLTGINKIKTAVFISGRGSNLKSLIKFSKKYKSPISIDLIVSNNPKAKGLYFGNMFKIKKKVFNFSNKKKAEDKALSELKKNDIKMICLAGFMKVLSKNFIKKFEGKILNIHPSLLPKYKGLNTHQRILNSKEKYSGKIILQKKVRILKNETVKSLTRKILAQEHKLYPEAILKIFSL